MELTRQRRILGGNFDDILHDLDNTSQKTNKESFVENQYIDINKITTSNYQPRKNFNEESLRDLSNSIKEQGILQPILVKQENNGKYKIIAGERRWRAAKQAGLKEVPVIIRNVSDSSAMAIALIENIQREDLNPIDEAVAVNKLIKDFALTHEQVAKSIGRSRTAVTNILRLLNLNSEVKILLEENKIDMGHARAILALEDADQLRIALLVIKRRLSVREAEQLVQGILKNKHGKISTINTYIGVAKEWEERLKEKMRSNVQVSINPKGKGRVVLNFDKYESTVAFLKFIDAYKESKHE